MAKRVFLIVLDSVGIGALPDAADFGDVGTNTLKRISQSSSFSAENLLKLGLGNIPGLDYLPKTKNPKGAFLRAMEQSKGKDTTVGHWEICGVISNHPLPTFPNGFPKPILSELTRLTGRKIFCNKPYSGTDVIRDYGAEALADGALIVYTSADSVFQIAAHEDVVPLRELYRICETARGLLTGPEMGVGRVIARPFAGVPGQFYRTANRRDYSLVPPSKTILDVLRENGKDVISVGKIVDIFAEQGITRAIRTHSNKEGMGIAYELLNDNFNGLCFVNLVDFDMLYGHRQDIDGYAAAFAAFDEWLPNFLSQMGKEDVLIVTADHGCDPGDNSTDHTREYIPIMIFGEPVLCGIYPDRLTYSDIGKTVTDYLGVKNELPGCPIPCFQKDERK